MEPVTRRDPRDLDLDKRIARLITWVVGTDQGRPCSVGDLIAAAGDNPQTVARSILRTDSGKAELTNILIKARLDGEACPDAAALAARIIDGAINPQTIAGFSADRSGIALILIPSAIAGLGLAGGLSPYLAILIIGAGWYLGWRILRRSGEPRHDDPG
jgi:hypothetical protein